MARKIEKIRVDMQAGRLQEDLEKYRQKALELGATKAAVIKAADIPVFACEFVIQEFLGDQTLARQPDLDTGLMLWPQ